MAMEAAIQIQEVVDATLQRLFQHGSFVLAYVLRSNPLQVDPAVRKPPQSVCLGPVSGSKLDPAMKVRDALPILMRLRRREIEVPTYNASASM